MRETYHIAVCIPTFKRPELLRRCLSDVGRQEKDRFTFSIVVVDNDAAESARPVIEEQKRRLPVRLSYQVEPVQSISLSRNRAITCSEGDLIAFIDDDEFPEPTWLVSLAGAYRRYGVDGVLGPVLSSYSAEPPLWLARSGLCDRPSLATGTILRDTKHLRTGNVLMGRHILDPDELPFDPRLGLTGGEDVDFFERMLQRGRSFVWCQEAVVHEEVPRERQRRSYFLRRALMRGVVTARSEPVLSLRTVKSLVAVPLYAILLPFLMLLGQHLFMRYLVKACDHIAKLLAHCGIALIKQRDF